MKYWFCFLAILGLSVGYASPLSRLDNLSTELSGFKTLSPEFKADTLSENATCSVTVLLDTHLPISTHQKMARQLGELYQQGIEVYPLLRGFPRDISGRLAKKDVTEYERDVNEKIRVYVDRGVDLIVDPQQYRHWSQSIEAQIRDRAILPAIGLAFGPHYEFVVGSDDLFWALAKILDSSTNLSFKTATQNCLTNFLSTFSRVYP